MRWQFVAITAFNPVITLQAGTQPSEVGEPARAHGGTWRQGRECGGGDAPISLHPVLSAIPLPLHPR